MLTRLRNSARKLGARRVYVRSQHQNMVDEIRVAAGNAAVLSQRAARHTFLDLWDAEFRVFSQWGEDGILSYLCDLLKLSHPRVLELGSGNFVECNSRYLAMHRGAKVVAVDARSDLLKDPAIERNLWRAQILGLQRWITPSSVKEIQSAAHEFFGEIDVLSLDIDGNDYWVAEEIDMSNVQIVVFEYNWIFGPNVPVSVPRDDGFDRGHAHWSNLYYGASLGAWVHLMRSRGFSLVGTNRACNNAFFCRDDRLDEIPLPKVSTQNLSRYMESVFREARDVNGNLTLTPRNSATKLVASLPVIDVTNGSKMTLHEIFE